MVDLASDARVAVRQPGFVQGVLVMDVTPAAQTARDEAQAAAAASETSKDAALAAETGAEAAATAAATSAAAAGSSESAAQAAATTATTKAGEAETSATEAATSATAAQTARTGAEAARDMAVDISNIDTSDAAIDAALQLPDGLAAARLSATIAAEGGAIFTPRPQFKDFGLHVSANGSDLNDGLSPSTAKASIRTAIADLPAEGGKIKLAGTVAAGAGPQLVLPTGTTVEGMGTNPATGIPSNLDVSAIAGGTEAIRLVAASDVRIKGLYITGRDATATMPEIATSGDCRGLVIEDVTVNSASQGTLVDWAGVYGGYVIKSRIVGLTVVGGSGIGCLIGPACTSIMLAASYANDCDVAGWDLRGTYLAAVALAADTCGLYGYSVSGVGISFLSCGSEGNGRTGWHHTGAKSISHIAGRAVGNGAAAGGFAPSYAALNDGTTGVSFNGCVDTTPDAAAPFGVNSWNGTAPTGITFDPGCDMTIDPALLPTLPAAATDAATTQALVNAIRTEMIARKLAD